MSDFRIDSYKFLPRSFRADFEAFPTWPEPLAPARLARPIAEARVALLTSAGLYLKDRQPPFDLERERREPWWGDPTFRVIPRDVQPTDLGLSHFHINPDDVLADFNIALPIQVFADLAARGEIGSLADEHYSVMGYQGDSTAVWQAEIGPAIAARLLADGVDLLILTPV